MANETNFVLMGEEWCRSSIYVERNIHTGCMHLMGAKECVCVCALEVGKRRAIFRHFYASYTRHSNQNGFMPCMLMPNLVRSLSHIPRVFVVPVTIKRWARACLCHPHEIVQQNSLHLLVPPNYMPMCAVYNMPFSDPIRHCKISHPFLCHFMQPFAMHWSADSHITPLDEPVLFAFTLW